MNEEITRREAASLLKACAKDPSLKALFERHISSRYGFTIGDIMCNQCWESVISEPVSLLAALKALDEHVITCAG